MAFLIALISMLIAVSFGTRSAFVGGWLDNLILSLTDSILTIPQFPLLVVLVTFISLNSLTFSGRWFPIGCPIVLPVSPWA